MFQNSKPSISGRNAIRPVRGIVVVNNQVVKFISFSVEQNGFSAADSFEIELPFFIRDEQLGDKILANGPKFESVLLSLDEIPVQVYVGYPKNPLNYQISDLTKIMDGVMDTATWDFDNTGEIITLSGRNMVGEMIDTKIVDKYPNLTSSAIAYNIAKNHKLTPVITNTTTLAGTYYNQNSTMMSNTDTTSEWDLLLFLAQQENFIVRVKGKKLLFGPYSVVTEYETASPLVYTWGYDIEKLEIERSPHGAKDIVVKVISFDKNNKNRIIETAKSGSQSNREKYTETYTIPGLTRDQAQKKAISIYTQLSRSQLIGQITCAGNVEMSIDRQIELHGVGSKLSQKYFLNKVTHKFTVDDNGYSIDASFGTFMPDKEES